jgi:hypothetical protein
MFGTLSCRRNGTRSSCSADVDKNGAALGLFVRVIFYSPSQNVIKVLFALPKCR